MKPEKIDYLRIAYGFFVTALIVMLALCIALGKVSKDTSFGLDGIITALSFLLGQWAQWAFKSSGARASQSQSQPTAETPADLQSS